MRTFLFTCPVTRFTVQGWAAADVSVDYFETVQCLACNNVHLVNPSNGKVAGAAPEPGEATRD
jgi:hypothetical protein